MAYLCFDCLFFLSLSFVGKKDSQKEKEAGEGDKAID